MASSALCVHCPTNLTSPASSGELQIPHSVLYTQPPGVCCVHDDLGASPKIFGASYVFFWPAVLRFTLVCSWTRIKGLMGLLKLRVSSDMVTRAHMQSLLKLRKNKTSQIKKCSIMLVLPAIKQQASILKHYSIINLIIYNQSININYTVYCICDWNIIAYAQWSCM